MKNFPWKTIWIIGASMGLGKEIANQLDCFGAKVIISARSEERLKNIEEGLKNTVSQPIDITNIKSINLALGVVKKICNGLPDLIILNAAIYQPMTTKSLEVGIIQEVMDVNFMGSVKLLNALLPYKNSGKKTTIATVTSPSGWRGLPGGIGYGSSKAALINFIESLRAELGNSDLDFRLVNPGFIRTRLTDKNNFHMPQIMEPQIAAQKLLKGLSSNRFEVAFPQPLIFFFKILRILPYWLYFKLTSKMI
ncbi:MAG: SDR family NAD(P)-dependent oxidoreductase [Sphingomonadales bacterium]|jgi:short-subunit dehydrogenase